MVKNPPANARDARDTGLTPGSGWSPEEGNGNPLRYSFFFLRYFIYFSFIFISWSLITLQYCSGFCHTLTWISHGFTCIPHPDPPSHLPLHPIPLLQYSCLENSMDRGACQAGYRQTGGKESDTTEHTCACMYTHTCVHVHTYTHTFFQVTYKTKKWKFQSNKLRT